MSKIPFPLHFKVRLANRYLLGLGSTVGGVGKGLGGLAGGLGSAVGFGGGKNKTDAEDAKAEAAGKTEDAKKGGGFF